MRRVVALVCLLAAAAPNVAAFVPQGVVAFYSPRTTGLSAADANKADESSAKQELKAYRSNIRQENSESGKVRNQRVHV